MLFIQLIMLCISFITYTSDNQNNGSITLQFKDGEQGTYPTRELFWSDMFKNMLEANPVTQSVPPLPMTKPIFDCLNDLMIETKDPLLFTSSDLPPLDLKNNIAIKLQRHSTINRHDLFLAANNLLAPLKTLNVIASFYADALKTTIPTITVQPSKKDKAKSFAIFDELPYELEPFVANWLLNDLLVHPNMKPADQSKTYTQAAAYPLWRIQLNNSGTHNSFVCAWTTLKHGGQDKKQYVYMNPLKASSITQTIETPYIDIAIGQCAVSSNGKYMILIGESNLTAYCVCLLYDLSNNKLTQQITLDRDIKDLVVVLFNDKTNMFDILVSKIKPGQNIVISRFIEPSEPKRMLSACYSINPEIDYYKDVVPRTVITDVSTLDLENMGWNCLDGKLIGVPYHYEKTDEKAALLYDHTTLYECTYDRNKECLSYQVKDTNKDVDCVIMTFEGYGIDGKRSFAIKNFSFIPTFKTEIVKRLNLLHNQFKSTAFAHNFDSHNLHINYIQIAKLKDFDDYTLGIFYPYDPRFLASLNFLSTEIIDKKRKNVLIDVYFLYQYHANPLQWQERCNHLLNFISPEIKKIYDMIPAQPEATSANITTTTSSTPMGTIQPQSWSTYLRQNFGQFWANPRQYLQSTFAQRRKQILYGGLAVGGGLTAWLLLNRYKNQLPATTSQFTPRLKRP